MIRDYRCVQCHSLLFKGSLELLSKRLALPTDDAGDQYIEVQCHERTCKHKNRFYLTSDKTVTK